MDTPYLAVDEHILDANISSMAAWAAAASVSIRPHAKTHKIIEIARRQAEAGAAGLTVATIGEAEVFAEAGFEDLFIAYPLWVTESTGERLRSVADSSRLRLAVSSAEGATQMAAHLRRNDVDVVAEIDSGHHRSGVAPANAGQLAASAVAAGLNVLGIFTFPGHSYAPGARVTAAQDEALALSEAAESLRSNGIDPDVCSGGSTPSVRNTDPDVVTETRPGVYVFNDAQQIELGTCSFDEVALTAVSAVVQQSGSRAIVDAGSKILGADRPAWATGFGRVAGHPDARIVALSEHHATVEFPYAAPALGSLISLIPNHVCNAVNLVDTVAVTRGGKVVDRWPVAARGRF